MFQDITMLTIVHRYGVYYLHKCESNLAKTLEVLALIEGYWILCIVYLRWYTKTKYDVAEFHIKLRLRRLVLYAPNMFINFSI